MSKITNIETYLQEKEFNQNVLPFFRLLNFKFDYLKENDECMFTVYSSSILSFFAKYIPKNIETHLPTPVERFHNVKYNPRISKGEWVIENVYYVPSVISNQLLVEANELPYEYSKIDFLKDKLNDLKIESQ